MNSDRVLQSGDRICVAHLEDAYLRRDVGAASSAADCSVCAAEEVEAVPLEHLARVVLAAARKRYDHVGFVPDGEQVLPTVPLRDVLATTLEDAVESDAHEPLVAAIEPLVRSSGPWYETFDEDTAVSTHFSWHHFDYRVKHQSRLLIAPTGEKPVTPPEWNYVLAREMVDFAAENSVPLILAPGTLLYRARVGRDAGDLAKRVRSDPSREMGPPPTDSASAGRLSAAGMPMLYTAREPETACAEVASHSPYDDCVVATLEVRQPLRLLDLTVIPKLPSIFSPTYSHFASSRTAFEFYRDRMMDFIPGDDRQTMEYLPSQLLTEAFRWFSVPTIHGIAYPSAAGTGGTNIALFFEDNEWITEPGAQPNYLASPSKPNTYAPDEWEFRGVLEVSADSVRQYKVEKRTAVHPV
ncbi:RES domain-containing protein [Microbacterium sp. BG28]|uniref:RES domain-containing protein n=1 Tax=Microbacterium sp. BG28 TaxID=3097356 RepID=UPI002A59A62D|nr:RES domain-containing protein [Microbacterium sp. BG28]MDY0829631.1 RES domain-containing protein [Microbacterium sp. BG28]